MMSSLHKTLSIVNTFADSDIVRIEFDKILEISKNFNDINLTNCTKKNSFKEIVYSSILDASLQFCFWYGHSSVRLFENSSSSITKLVKEYYHSPEILKNELRKNRYTLLNERISIIDEIGYITDRRISRICYLIKSTKDIHIVLDYMMEAYTCFSDDLLMKKAILALISIHRCTGIFNNMDELIIPADYQIPNVLRTLGVLIYNEKLSKKINDNEIILRNSLEEISIRTSAIKAVMKISEITNIPSWKIDQILFSIKDIATYQHHLTLTTSY